MSSDSTTGIPNPDKPGHWLVPPWATDATFCEVVRHFLRFHLWCNTSTAHLLAYYDGYRAALEAAPTDELRYPGHWRWFEDMRDCVGRCTRLYQEKRAAEAQQVKGNVSALQTPARTTHRMPALHEIAS